MFWDTLFILALVVLLSIPPVFVYYRVYDDGVFGRLGLLGISFFALALFLEQIFGVGYDMPRPLIGLLAAVAIFICWHLLRFHSRVLKKRGPTPCGLRDQLGCPYVNVGHVVELTAMRRSDLTSPRTPVSRSA